MDETPLLTVQEIANRLRVGPESVRRWLRSRQLAGVNLGPGAGWRIQREDFQHFIEERYSPRQLNRSDSRENRPQPRTIGIVSDPAFRARDDEAYMEAHWRAE